MATTTALSMQQQAAALAQSRDKMISQIAKRLTASKGEFFPGSQTANTRSNANPYGSRYR